MTELEAQVRKLSEQVRISVHDAAAARVLAGGADREVNEVRDELRDFRHAVSANFNAMRDDLNDLRQTMNDGFARIDDRFTEIDGRFEKVDSRFADIDRRFEQIDSRFEQVDGEFAKVDRGFADVRGKLEIVTAGHHRIVEMLTVLIEREGDQEVG